MAPDEEKCEPCKGSTPPMSYEEATVLAGQAPEWSLQDHSALAREWTFRDFREAIAFVNRVADEAEAQGHHPDICISYNKVRLVLTTHTIHGLSRNDFILAAKIDRLE